MFPAGSICRTRNVYTPSGSSVRSSVWVPELHALNWSTTVLPLVRAHSNVELRSPVYVQVGVSSAEGSVGPLVMLGAPGATRSSVYELVASTEGFPARSVWRTWIVYAPSGCEDRS